MTLRIVSARAFMAKKGSTKSSSRNGTSTKKSSARTTVSGPSRGRGGAKTSGGDALLTKLTGTDELAAAMPANVNKAAEYGTASRTPPEGQHGDPPDDSVTASTLTEATKNAKVGTRAPLGRNPGQLPLDRV